MARLFMVAATFAGGDLLHPAASSSAAVVPMRKARFVMKLPFYRSRLWPSVRIRNSSRHKENPILKVGMIGTGAISDKHAQAYKNIGFDLVVCTDIIEEAGRRFAAQYGARFVKTYEEVCSDSEVDFVDVCTFPDFRLQPLEICARHGKHIQVQKPISTNVNTARQMIDTARRAGIQLGV